MSTPNQELLPYCACAMERQVEYYYRALRTFHPDWTQHRLKSRAWIEAQKNAERPLV